MKAQTDRQNRLREKAEKMTFMKASTLCLFMTAISAGCIDPESFASPVAEAIPQCTNAEYLGRTIEINSESLPLTELLQPQEVLLTFDDGPHPKRTDAMLDLLNAHCIKAIFFLRGDNALKYPEQVRRQAAEGFLQGGHSVKHDHLTELAPEVARADIQQSLENIAAAFESPAAHRPYLFRFPYFESNEDLDGYLASQGLIAVGANVSSMDWAFNTPEDIVDHVMNSLKDTGNKGVILLHEPFPYTLAATEALINDLIAENYRFVSVKLVEGEK